MQTPALDCPCGSGKSCEACCGQFLDGKVHAPTAEALMRSRYTAYVLQNESYLLSTWHDSTRPATLDLINNQPDQWLGLTIRKIRNGVLPATAGEVEFVARYKYNGRAVRLHENSRFVYEHDQWYYVDGKLIE